MKVAPPPPPAAEPQPKEAKKPVRPAPRVVARAVPRVAPRPARAATAPFTARTKAQAEVFAETAIEASTPGGFDQSIPMSPVQGSEIPLEKVPAAVSQVTSSEIERTGSPAIEQAIQHYVPGAIVSDVNGNPFSTDILFRGFTSSPVEGTPQGLAIYKNGVRINEVFGDTVNWELIPATAIKSIALVTGNPLYA